MLYCCVMHLWYCPFVVKFLQFLYFVPFRINCRFFGFINPVFIKTVSIIAMRVFIINQTGTKCHLQRNEMHLAFSLTQSVIPSDNQLRNDNGQ